VAEEGNSGGSQPAMTGVFRARRSGPVGAAPISPQARLLPAFVKVSLRSLVKSGPNEAAEGSPNMSPMRLLIAEFKHESNTFASRPTGRAEYEARYIKRAGEIIPFFTGVKSEIGGFIEGARQAGAELVPVIAANAMPSGVVTREMFNYVRDAILQGIRTSGRIDGIALSLHGAMVVEDSFDGEGELLEAIRNQVGPDLPLMITLDFHANLTPKMMSNCSAMFGYNTYPHVDTYERGLEALLNLVKMIRGELRPVMALEWLPMLIPSLETSLPPFSRVFDAAFAMEKDPRVVNVSWFQGFPWTDIPYAGSAVVAVTDDDPALAGRLARELAQQVWEMRELFRVEVMTPAAAIAKATQSLHKPFVLADISDNPGGGAPSDGTQVIKALLDAGAKDAVVATIHDPQVVEQAVRAGVRATIDIELGGKTEPAHLHGEPLKLKAMVRTISDGRYVNKGPMGTGFKVDNGVTVVLDLGGVEVIVPERKLQPADPEILRRHGIEPRDKQMVVLKSTLHYRAAFAPLAHEIIQLDGAGLTSPNFSTFRYRNLGVPRWPLSPDARP